LKFVDIFLDNFFSFLRIGKMEKDKIKELERKNKALKARIKELEKKAEEYLNGWKRAKADYLNLEKQVNQEKQEWIRFANWDLVNKLIPVLDSFEKALADANDSKDENPWFEGLRQIRDQMEKVLKDIGLSRIKTIGQKYNPEYHEVIEKKGEKGKIIQEIQAGYMWHDKVIRPAKVIIE